MALEFNINTLVKTSIANISLAISPAIFSLFSAVTLIFPMRLSW